MEPGQVAGLGSNCSSFSVDILLGEREIIQPLAPP